MSATLKRIGIAIPDLGASLALTRWRTEASRSVPVARMAVQAKIVAEEPCMIGYHSVSFRAPFLKYTCIGNAG